MDRKARSEVNRRRSEAREPTTSIPDDPLQLRRDELLKDPNPCVRVCGQVSEGYTPDHGQLLEDINPEAFTIWLKVAENQKTLDRAIRLGLAKYDFERRNTALGLGTRRGQQASLKSARVEFQRMAPATIVDAAEAQIPHETPEGSGDGELTPDEMEKLEKVAAFSDNAGN